MAPTTRLQGELIKKIEEAFPIVNKNGNTKTVSKTNRPKIAAKRNEKNKFRKFYNMSSNPRGYCLIFANFNFEHHGSLIGYSSDALHLENIFNELGFVVKLYKNCSVEKIESKIKKYSKMKPNNNSQEPDAFAVVILTHGRQNGPGGSGTQLIGANAAKIPTESECVDVEDLIDLVNNMNCKLLRNKPKLFFIQACRGDKEDMGVSSSGNDDIEINGDNHYEEESQDRMEVENGFNAVAAGSSTSDALLRIEQNDIPETLPTRTDIMVCYSTIIGHKSYVFPTFSLFGRALAYILIKFSNQYDLKSLMTMLSDQIKNLDVPICGDKKMKQPIEERYINFTGLLYFNPKYFANQAKVLKPRKASKQVSEPTPTTSTKTITQPEVKTVDNSAQTILKPNTRQQVLQKKLAKTNGSKSKKKTIPLAPGQKTLDSYYKPKTTLNAPLPTVPNLLDPVSSNGVDRNNVRPKSRKRKFPKKDLSKNNNDSENDKTKRNIMKFKKTPPKKFKKT